MQQDFTRENLEDLDYLLLYLRHLFVNDPKYIEEYHNSRPMQTNHGQYLAQMAEKLRNILKKIMAKEKFGDQDLINLSLFRKQVDQIQTALQYTAHHCTIIAEQGKELQIPAVHAQSSLRSVELNEIATIIGHQVNSKK